MERTNKDWLAIVCTVGLFMAATVISLTCYTYKQDMSHLRVGQAKILLSQDTLIKDTRNLSDRVLILEQNHKDKDK